MRRLVSNWVASIGLDARLFGTHSLRRAKATLISRHTGNLRAVQLLLGHRKIESTVRYLGIEVDDALAIAEQVDVRHSGQSGNALPAFRGQLLTRRRHQMLGIAALQRHRSTHSNGRKSLL